MMNLPSPASNYHNPLLQMLESVIHERSAAYVAGSLNSGLLSYQRKLTNVFDPVEVRATNQARLTNFAKQLRNKLDCPVIDPGILQVSEWTGSDYSIFFLEVIKVFANQVWFVGDWQYSDGATKEFQFCIVNDIKCFNEYGETLTATSGELLIKKAIQHIKNLGFDTPLKLENRLNLTTV